ncbi:MAG: hypothetical protein OXU61_01660 [Gammaproteobacteria bacterium]|nr:hypothetical protein [Gammaproteobacteria bacterium]
MSIGVEEVPAVPPHRRDIGLAPSSCRLPLEGGVMRIRSGAGFASRGSVRGTASFAAARIFDGLPSSTRMLDSCFRRNSGEGAQE